MHKAYTGVENAQILDNIRYLLCSEELRDRVIIRTPLIPEMTARSENITAIAQFLQQCYKGVRYELLIIIRWQRRSMIIWIWNIVLTRIRSYIQRKQWSHSIGLQGIRVSAI